MIPEKQWIESKNNILENPLKDLDLLPSKLSESLKEMFDQFSPSHFGKNIQDTDSAVYWTLSKIEMTDTNGDKTNAAAIVWALFSVWGKLKKIFDFDSDTENGEELGDYHSSTFESATENGDQSAAERAYNEYDKSIDRSKRPRGLMWVGPQRNPKTWTTLCDKSAREFLSGILGVPVQSIQRSWKDAKTTETLYPPSLKLSSISQVQSYHANNPNAAFAVFMDSKSPYGHAAAAYFQRMPDGRDRLMIYDPYDKSVEWKERGEAFPIEMHSRASTMRFVPLMMDRSSMTSQVASLVSDGSSNASNIASSWIPLEIKRLGHWEKLPSLSQSDLEEISRMVQAEAWINNTEWQLRVAAVILNRMMSWWEFPRTAMGVLHQRIAGNPGKFQFSPMHDGRINQFNPDQNIIESLKRMIASGKDPSQWALFFQAHNIGMDNWVWKNGEQTVTDGKGGNRFFRII
jgi:hypothetical protein